MRISIRPYQVQDPFTRWTRLLPYVSILSKHIDAQVSNPFFAQVFVSLVCMPCGGLLCVMTFTNSLLLHSLYFHMGGFGNWSGVYLYFPSLGLLNNIRPDFYSGVAVVVGLAWA